MPAVSKAQNRFFHWAEAHPKESGVSKKVSREFNAATKSTKGLPERKREDRGKRWYGGKGE